MILMTFVAGMPASTIVKITERNYQIRLFIRKLSNGNM